MNTRTGNYWTKVTDLQVESPGIPIVWTRTYNSQAVGQTTVLGAGWQHPYNARLITPAMSGGEAGRVIIQDPTGNRLRFDGPLSGPFDPWPGVNSTLVKSGATYIQTLRDQSQYLFRDSDGMLTAVRDPQGWQIDLIYNPSIPAQLDTIRDASNTARALQLSYSSGQISSILDSLGSRSISYGYDAQGNLATVTDVRQQTTSYSYATPSNHLLTRIRNPLSQDVERIGYKTSVTPSQVLTQTLQDGRNIAFAFPAPAAIGGTTVITSTGSDGRADVLQLDYAGDNTLLAMRDTTNKYDGLGRTVLVTETGILTGTFNTTPLRFSDITTRTMRTEYDELSRPVTVTLNYRPDLPPSVDRNVKMLTGYDAAGNVLRQTDTLGRWTVMQYDVLNRPVRTIANYQNGQVATNEPADQDLISTTSYDAGGRVSQTIENYLNGVVDATDTITDRTTLYQYDSLSRVITTTVNAGPLSGPEWNRKSVTRYDPITTQLSAQRTPQFLTGGVTDERWTRM